MLGAAYGDSLGAAAEWLSTTELKEKFGPEGISICQPFYGRPAGVITDDTQMAIATARGVARAMSARVWSDKIQSDKTVLERIWQEYLEWYQTQMDPAQRRGPGNTCIAALQGGIKGSVDNPLNNGSGCGGVMRVHPIGIFWFESSARAFDLGLESAALTHGNPDAYFPAGLQAAFIADLMEGQTIDWVMETSLMVGEVIDVAWTGSPATKKALEEACNAPIEGDTMEIIDHQVGRIGAGNDHLRAGGWLGHDALAIAIYAIRASRNVPVKAVKIAVNHSGDSDSTGSIAGALVGAMLGPEPFLQELGNTGVELERFDELKDLSRQLSME